LSFSAPAKEPTQQHAADEPADAAAADDDATPSTDQHTSHAVASFSPDAVLTVLLACVYHDRVEANHCRMRKQLGLVVFVHCC
jgi:hypothetical protein